MAARQAVVVIHGMGEQRPVETLNRFSKVITPPGKLYYSKIDRLTDSFEARRHLIPPQEGLDTQTEIYEYHWSYMMKGNRLGDLFPLLRRMLLPVPGWWGAPLSLLSVAAAFIFAMSINGPLEDSVSVPLRFAAGVLAMIGVVFVIRSVPVGLTVLWLLLWAGIGWVTWAVIWGPFAGLLGGLDITNAVKILVGGGVTAIVVTYIVANALPRWLTSSFVDVVRYLDTSPRSYEVRKEIRAGIVGLLQAIHDYGRYQRVVVVAHSLGSYIAYDAISHLWGEMAKLHKGPYEANDRRCDGGTPPDGLNDLEAAASDLDADDPTALERFRTAQRGLWVGIRKAGNPWLITDFISFGSPMYFADVLYTRDHAQLVERTRKQELIACPPESETNDCNNVNGHRLFFTWNNGGRRVLHDAAPFAVVRWTNFWYPAVAGFFGDWFGGRLAPLFGNGIKDVALTGDRPYRWIPGAAHALYLGNRDNDPGSFAAELADTLEIDAGSWFPPQQTASGYDQESRISDSTIHFEV